MFTGPRNLLWTNFVSSNTVQTLLVTESFLQLTSLSRRSLYTSAGEQ